MTYKGTETWWGLSEASQNQACPSRPNANPPSQKRLGRFASQNTFLGFPWEEYCNELTGFGLPFQPIEDQFAIYYAATVLQASLLPETLRRIIESE
jgi:hypothetical protein